MAFLSSSNQNKAKLSASKEIQITGSDENDVYAELSPQIIQLRENIKNWTISAQRENKISDDGTYARIDWVSYHLNEDGHFVRQDRETGKRVNQYGIEGIAPPQRENQPWTPIWWWTYTQSTVTEEFYVPGIVSDVATINKQWTEYVSSWKWLIVDLPWKWPISLIDFQRAQLIQEFFISWSKTDRYKDYSPLGAVIWTIKEQARVNNIWNVRAVPSATNLTQTIPRTIATANWTMLMKNLWANAALSIFQLPFIISGDSWEFYEWASHVHRQAVAVVDSIYKNSLWNKDANLLYLKEIFEAYAYDYYHIQQFFSAFHNKQYDIAEVQLMVEWAKFFSTSIISQQAPWLSDQGTSVQLPWEMNMPNIVLPASKWANSILLPEENDLRADFPWGAHWYYWELFIEFPHKGKDVHIISLANDDPSQYDYIIQQSMNELQKSNNAFIVDLELAIDMNNDIPLDQKNNVKARARRALEQTWFVVEENISTIITTINNKTYAIDPTLLTTQTSWILWLYGLWSNVLSPIYEDLGFVQYVTHSWSIILPGTWTIDFHTVKFENIILPDSQGSSLEQAHMVIESIKIFIERYFPWAAEVHLNIDLLTKDQQDSIEEILQYMSESNTIEWYRYNESEHGKEKYVMQLWNRTPGQ